ncbi:methyltransferase domain-containing protein [Candidatus Saccharibacteria bacterium]|nr:methyltransferase domain-containing protein [Candidatus Saccharibacteria bacterium]
MYQDLAEYYDEIYSYKDYAAEAGKVIALIKSNLKTGGNKLLDAACGTGKHIGYFKQHYDVTGVDISDKMLGLAKERYPDVQFHQADMMNMKLGRDFDVLVCLFSSIAHLKTYKNLNKALKNFSRHLKKGGVLIIEPFIEPDKYIAGALFADMVNRPELKITRMNISKRKKDIATLDFHWLIGTPKNISYYRDRHEVGLFDIEKFKKLMAEAGFDAAFLKDGLLKDRGLFLGIKN